MPVCNRNEVIEQLKRTPLCDPNQVKFSLDPGLYCVIPEKLRNDLVAMLDLPRVAPDPVGGVDNEDL